jgi:glycosyltransferase involved in cell wall biosynthesis
MLTYNRAEYLREAIASVVAQTHTNWELIIIDDGSTDDTAAVVKSFGESRIRYIQHQENAGLFARRAESLRYVKGEYIAVLDSDDYWCGPNKLKEQVALLDEQPQCVLVGTFVKLVDEAGQEIGRNQFAQGDIDIRERILLRNQFVHSSVLMRTEAVRQTTGYQPTLAEDLELFLELGQLGSMSNLPIYATAHRVHDKSENDRGVKMLSAVKNIITTHKDDYSHYRRAWWWVRVRLLVAYGRRLFDKLRNIRR